MNIALYTLYMALYYVLYLVSYFWLHLRSFFFFFTSGLEGSWFPSQELNPPLTVNVPNPNHWNPGNSLNYVLSVSCLGYGLCCSVAQSCLTLCNPNDCTTPGFPVLHHLPELAQTPVHWVGDAIQPSHPLSSPSPPAFYLFQHQFHWGIWIYLNKT